MPDYPDSPTPLDTQSLTQRLAMSMLPGVNIRTGRTLLDKLGQIDNLFDMSAEAVRNLTGMNRKHWNSNIRDSLLEKAATELQFVTQHRLDCRFFADEDAYPFRLAQCEDAPALLYSLGRCELNAQHVVSIVGTRHATAQGVEFTRRLVEELAERLDGLLIISGLAYGIDIAAHRAALAANVPTVAVLAQPLNTIYPADHRSDAQRILEQGGALITEYATYMPIHRGNFLARNRIIAGLSDVTVVVESDERGGAMSTARCANAYDRDVFAMPGRVTDRYSRGCNKLIATDLAHLLTCAEDIIKMLRWKQKEVEGTQKTLALELTPDQQMVLDAITANPQLTVNDFVVRLGLSYSRLTDILFNLEMAGLITAVPGNRFAVISL